MSLLNIALGETEALIFADSQRGYPGEIKFVSKLHALPHMPAILAGRGWSTTTEWLWVALVQTALDFDRSVESMPLFLDRVMSEVRRQFGGNPDIEKQELALVGWSARYRRPAAFVWVQIDPQAGFARREIERGWLSPSVTGLEKLAKHPGVTPLDICRYQARETARLTGRQSSGGAVFRGVISRHGLAIEKIGEIEALSEPAMTGERQRGGQFLAAPGG